MLNQELEIFCSNWLDKADMYNHEELQGAFDKFFSLFVVYNRLYVEVTFRMSNRGEINLSNRKTFPDAEAAKNYVVQYLTSRTIDEAFNADNSCLNAIESLKNLIRNYTFFIKLDMVTGMPDRDLDLNLLERLESNHTDKKVKAITDFIYSIRCNLFHAQKGYSQDQVIILKPLITLLHKIIQMLFSKLKED
jgi:hypothetical protein